MTTKQVYCKKARNQFVFLEEENLEYMFDFYGNKWVQSDQLDDYHFMSFYVSGKPCRSYKAAIRHLRKHNEIPVGTQFRLVSRLVGLDRTLRKK